MEGKLIETKRLSEEFQVFVPRLRSEVPTLEEDLGSLANAVVKRRAFGGRDPESGLVHRFFYFSHSQESPS